ncbi:MAG: response regulator transcription factor [Dysgonamonadaceae bacterium]|jgi:DNA-binding response OmpR family regulator|nr:response regulator transcription factor [Dysgonamonadaceae bacterium]
MKKIKLLLVEDDEAFAFIVKGSLELLGNYEVCTAKNGFEGLQAYASYDPDIIVSDIEMPEMSGFDFIKKVRERDLRIPVLFASGRTNPRDVINGYEIGVDNYIKKPYLIEELNAHIRAILKRIPNFGNEEENKAKGLISIGQYLLHVGTRTLQIKGGEYKLTEMEAKILMVLYEHRGELVKKDDLLAEVWGSNGFFASRSLDVFVSKLRKYLEADKSVKINTLRGEGLLMIV